MAWRAAGQAGLLTPAGPGPAGWGRAAAGAGVWAVPAAERGAARGGRLNRSRGARSTGDLYSGSRPRQRYSSLSRSETTAPVPRVQRGQDTLRGAHGDDVQRDVLFILE